MKKETLKEIREEVRGEIAERLLIITASLFLLKAMSYAWIWIWEPVNNTEGFFASIGVAITLLIMAAVTILGVVFLIMAFAKDGFNVEGEK